MYQLRLVCYMGLDAPCNMEVPEDAVHLALVRSARIGANREQKDMRWSVAVVGEELVADDVADVQCSRVEVVEGGAAEDPAARGGDDAA